MTVFPAGVLKDNLDRSARRIGVDDDDCVDDLACEAKRLLADQLDGRAV